MENAVEKILMQQTLILAENIDIFKNSCGKRNMNMPYYVRAAKSSSFSFHFISKETDPVCLEKLINAYRVYVLEQHVGGG